MTIARHDIPVIRSRRSAPVRLVGLALGMAAGIAAASAGTPEGQYALRGLGGARCEDLTAAADGGQAQQVRDLLAAWIAGYLTHANRVGAGAFDLVDVQDDGAVAAVVLNLCRKNPAAAAEPVLAALVQKLAAWQISGSSPQLEVAGVAGTTTRIREETLMRVQELLTRQGYMSAPATPGTFDDATGAALSALQAARSLPVTGVPDATTLLSLALTP